MQSTIHFILTINWFATCKPLCVKYVCISLLAIVMVNSAFAQENQWEPKKETDNLSVYYRDVPDSKLKELKVSTTFRANLSTIVAVLRDVPAYPLWIYGCEAAEVVERKDNANYIYAQMDFPWPLSDRDYYAKATLHQDSQTKQVTSYLVALPTYSSEKEDFVRIPKMEVTWIFTPLDKNTVQLDYLLSSDPGGALPSWLVNMFLDKGPTKSLARFREMLQLDKYKNQNFAIIQN
ncbi:MAG: START domain-containing protein [Bacteroidota bacterium]